MKFRLKLIPLFFIPLLLACNLSNLIGSTTMPSKTTPISGQPAVAPLSTLEGQVRQAVTEFLNSLQSDPAGQKSLVYLNENLQSQVNGGTPLAQLLGIQNTIPKFELSAVTFSPDAAEATVDVTLLYTAPANVRFHLLHTEAGWKIDAITPLSGGIGDPAAPEQVVQAFITAYQETPDLMSKYLSSTRLSQLPPGGAVAMLNIDGELEGSMIESAAVNPVAANATVTVLVQSGGKGYTRIFTLTKEKNQWKIDTIEGQ